MKKVVIESGCIGCASCEIVCPEVFKVECEAIVLEGADLEKNKECIKEAAAICPVDVIKYEQ